MDEEQKQAAQALDPETEQLLRREDELLQQLDDSIAATLEQGGTAPAAADAGTAAIAAQTIAAEQRQADIDTRVLRDFDDGIITFDRSFNICFINPSASRILGLTGNAVGLSYEAVFGKENTALAQFLQAGSAQHNSSHRGELLFRRADGQTMHLNASCMCLEDDELPGGICYALHFDDITELETLRKKRRESSSVFIGTMTAISVWTFFVAAWQAMGRPVSEVVMTQFIHVIAIIMFLFIRRSTSFTLAEMGFRIKGIKKAVITDALFTALAVLLMVVGKLVLLKLKPGFFPAGKPFWDWSVANWADYIYPLTVVLQEFLSRGVIHECLRRIIVGKHSEAISIIISSLLFGALHIHRGIGYMIGSTLLLGLFGILYRKQNTIWGLCIPHYVLGEVVAFLQYV